MRMASFCLGLSVVLSSFGAQAWSQDAAIAWAYPGAPEKMPLPELPPSVTFHVAGSPLTYTGGQLNEMEEPVDWLPANHPVPPDLVRHGAKDRGVEACGGCHGFEGQGFLNIPGLVGLKSPYIVEQLHEFASGRRHSSVAARPPELYMAGIAGKLSEAEIKAAAAYFSSIPKRRPFVRVVETDTVPRTSAHHEGWQTVEPGGALEPIGRRVVLVAENFDQMWTGDPTAMAVAYVPRDAVEHGKTLVEHAGQPCTSCHGATLKGIGAAPSLAGRNPQYLARAIWDIKSGARSGPATAPMQKPASSLSADQIVDVVAYLASLAP